MIYITHVNTIPNHKDNRPANDALPFSDLLPQITLISIQYLHINYYMYVEHVYGHTLMISDNH